MLAVMFMWKHTGIAALIILPRTFKSYKEKFSAYISWNVENWIEPYRKMLLFSFQKGSINNNKVLASFRKTLAWKLKRVLQILRNISIKFAV